VRTGPNLRPQRDRRGAAGLAVHPGRGGG
jgi:hypothetical protein